MIAAAAAPEESIAMAEARVLAQTHGPWSIEEFLALPQDAHRYELLDGSLLMAPAPAIGHQRSSGHLLMLLYPLVPKDWDVIQDTNLRLEDDTLLRPDVLVARRRHGVAFDAKDAILVVEIVSPSSKSMDRITKPGRYAEAGIEWYMRVELSCPHDNPPEVTVYRLVEGGYVEDACAHAGQVLSLTEPVTISFDPAVLMQDRI